MYANKLDELDETDKVLERHKLPKLTPEEIDTSHEIKMLTPWKKSYDQRRQHIKKQRHYFANKGPSHQGYGFSSTHVWL